VNKLALSSSEAVRQDHEEGEGMTPIQIIEGTRTLDPTIERRLAERRFSALAAAVREHEANVRRREFQIRPQDQALYRRLRQICGLGDERARERETA
jgi:hypothetical protein